MMFNNPFEEGQTLKINTGLIGEAHRLCMDTKFSWREPLHNFSDSVIID